eukprot:5288426-Lingulodinium_polyedra.AAC.1
MNSPTASQDCCALAALNAQLLASTTLVSIQSQTPARNNALSTTCLLYPRAPGTIRPTGALAGRPPPPEKRETTE